VAADSLQALLDGIVAWLLTYALHSTVLIALAWLAAVAIARAACRSQWLRDALPSIRERLWKLALVGGLVTASVQSGLGLDPWGLKLALRSSAAVEHGTQALVPDAPRFAAQANVPPAQTRALQSAAPAAVVPPAAPSIARSTEPATERAPQSSWSNWVVIALALWGMGVLFGLARWACQWNRLLRNLDDREPIVSGHVYEIFQHLRVRGSVRRDVRLSAAPGLHAPITLGVRRCEICLPPRVATELQHDEIGALLAHELAHAERRDPTWVVACRAIEVVFFFQPLNRVCASWLADEAEYLCDDRAVVRIGERVALASCLTEIAGWIVHSTPTRLAPGMAAPGTRLSLRVGRLLDEDHDPAAPQASRWTTVALLPAALSVALFVPGVVAEARADGDDSASVDVASEPSLVDRAREIEIAWQGDPATIAGNPAAESDVDAAIAPGADVAVESEADAQDPAPQSAPAQVSTATSAGAAPAEVASTDDDELAPIGEEIALLRAELSTRSGGKSLAHRLDALDARWKVLEKRASDLHARIERLEHAGPPAMTPVTFQVLSDTSVYLVPSATKD
jgi:beta-lactamase regulating signal transducer with metallopeptidase domain